MEDDLEDMSLRHHRSAAAGASRHNQHRRRAKKAAAANTSYDDVFGGPPRHAVPLSGVPEDYSEVFGGVSVSCSIPFLNLPATHGGWGDEETRNGGVDYGEIFGRCEFADFAVPYEELFGKGRRMEEQEEEDGEVELHFALDNGRSSFKSRSGPQTIDPSVFIQEYSNEDAIPYLDDANFSVASDEMPMEYNTSYSKSSRTRSKELLHTTASVPEPQTGFTFVVEPDKPLPEHLPVVNEDTATHENDVQPNSKPAATTQTISHEEAEEPGVPFLDVADVSLLTRSANLPPPARPPPSKFLVNERHKVSTIPKTDAASNLSTEAEQPPLPQQEKPKSFLKSDSLPPNFDFVPNLKLDKREKPKLKSRPNTFSKSESLPPGFGSELDAMKEAMEFAQARLKTAKELHEKKREGKITELPLRKKPVKEESLEGSEVEKPRILRSNSLASNFSKSREFMKVQSGVAATQGTRELEKSGKWRSDEEFHELTSIELTKEKESKVGSTVTEPMVERNKDSVPVNEFPPTGVKLTRNLNADVNATVNLDQTGEMKSGKDSKREEETATGSLEVLTGSQEPVIKKEPITIQNDFSFEFEREIGDKDIEALKEYAKGIPNVEDVVDIEEVEAETKDGSNVKFGTEIEDGDRNRLDELQSQNMKEELEKVMQVEKEMNEEKEKERSHKLEEEEDILLQPEDEEERKYKLEDEKERELQMEKDREEEERREQERIMAEEEERLERERMQKWQEENERERLEKEEEQRMLAEKRERERLEKEEEQRMLAEKRERERKLEEERQEEKMREKEMLRKLEEERERERKLAEEVKKERERVRKLEEEMERERERVRMLEEEKQREREMALKLEKEKERERELQEEIEKERGRVRKLEEEREQEREKVRKLEEERELERERVRKLEEEREQERERVRQLEEERGRERIEREREWNERQKMEQRERERIAKEREQKELEKKLEEEREKQRIEKEKEDKEKQRRMEKEREEKEMAMRLEAEKRRLERKRAEEREKMIKLQGEKAKERKTESRKSDEEREREIRMKEKERKPEGRKSDEEREKAWGRKSDEEKEKERGRRARKEREMEERERDREDEEEERQREREKDRLAMERATQERAERIAIERITAARQRAVENREKEEMNTRGVGEGFEKKRPKGEEEKKERDGERNAREARLRAERAAVERATAEARERAIEKAKADADKERLERLKSFSRISSQENGQESHFKRTQSDSALSQGHGESALRHRARLERQQRTAERAAKALAEKNRRDIMAQREQAERDRIAEHLDADVRRWSSGKEGNLRALLSTLQYILGQNSGWQPIHLTEVITAADVKRAYRKATLYVHPDKLQQRGASIQQKYICEKVFDLLKEAWNKFNSEER